MSITKEGRRLIQVKSSLIRHATSGCLTGSVFTFHSSRLIVQALGIFFLALFGLTPLSN